MASTNVCIVVPCYNEEARLQKDEFVEFAKQPGLHLIFVNDGSTDRTLEVLNELAQSSHEGSIEALNLPENAGKAEAVRQGLLLALTQQHDWIGFLDADLATPPSEMIRLIDHCNSDKLKVIMGSRVQLLGRQIERKASRHYLGRIFATLASLSLKIPVYDTQCGAKLFKVTDGLKTSLASPFESRWIFDVELFQRLMQRGYTVADFLEVPLFKWFDIKGSKLSIGHMAKAGYEIFRLYCRSLKG